MPSCKTRSSEVVFVEHPTHGNWYCFRVKKGGIAPLLTKVKKRVVDSNRPKHTAQHAFHLVIDVMKKFIQQGKHSAVRPASPWLTVSGRNPIPRALGRERCFWHRTKNRPWNASAASFVTWRGDRGSVTEVYSTTPHPQHPKRSITGPSLRCKSKRDGGCSAWKIMGVPCPQCTRRNEEVYIEAQSRLDTYLAELDRRDREADDSGTEI